jgi:hypothetical protein
MPSTGNAFNVSVYDTDKPLMTSGGSGYASKSSVQNYSSSYSSSQVNGGVPNVEWSKDSSFRSSTAGTGQSPHVSFASTSSAYSSDQPWKNKNSSFSYNI